MIKRASLLLCLSCYTLISNAALIDRGNGLIYDSDLDITWLQDVNFVLTENFGVTPTVSSGKMFWSVANDWIAGMNAHEGVGYVGHNNWRLPSTSPINGSTFNDVFSNNATTDSGYATSAGWVDGDGNPTSELGYMYYVNLGNLGSCAPDDIHPSACDSQVGSGLINTGPFINFQTLSSNSFWYGQLFDSKNAWHIGFDFGRKNPVFYQSGAMAWAVHDGDIGAVPIPSAIWLFVSGLIGLIGFARHKV